MNEQPTFSEGSAQTSLAPLIKPVETLAPSASCLEAAKLMRSRNIGSVVVASDGEPLGVVTDRDLTIRVLAEGRDAGTLRLEQVMSPQPIFLSVRRSLDEAIAVMRDLGVRRLPVINERGHLVGIVSMDDILARIARQLGQLGEAVQRELEHGILAYGAAP